MLHGYGMMGHWETMGAPMWLTMVLFWGLAIFGLICLIRWVYQHFRHDDRNK